MAGTVFDRECVRDAGADLEDDAAALRLGELVARMLEPLEDDARGP